MESFKILAVLSFFLILGWGQKESFAQVINEGSTRGLTLETVGSSSQLETPFFTASCNAKDGNSCNSYEGDTLCHMARPLLCFLDIDAPIPQTLMDDSHWTGGLLATSSPIRGNYFSSLQDANNYCASIFGKGWRVASFHDGGGGQLKGYGAPPHEETSAWVDIKNRPNATCWSR